MKPSQWIPPVAVGLATAGAVAYKAIRAKDGPRGILVIAGDSYAAGLGPALTAAPKLPMAAVCDLTVTGIPGTTSRQWAEVVGESLKSKSRNWVVFSLGTNDTGAPLGQLRGDVATIAAACKTYHTGLAWIAPPRAVRAKVPSVELCWSVWRRTVGEGRCFDTDAHVSVPIGPDGLHPVSYRPWAEALWKWLAILTA